MRMTLPDDEKFAHDSAKFGFRHWIGCNLDVGMLKLSLPAWDSFCLMPPHMDEPIAIAIN
jgi:hypothetical protein